jgi:anaerobic selenocysteine-containing dehydrogenase
MSERVRTQCPYCGVGCGLLAEVRDGRLTAVSGDPDHPVNRGATCRKPLGLPDAVHAEDRARHPLWRDSTEARFERVSWRQAIGRLARRIETIVDHHGPDALAFYISGQLLTEDYYIASKLVKGFLGTNNLDSNSRLCMSSAVAAYAGALGSDGPPAAYADIERADCLLLAGTNTAACHPIVWTRIAARHREGAGLIVIDPRRTPTAEAADIHLPIRPGTDLPLLSAMLGVLADEGLVDRLFVERYTEGYDEALAAACDWPVTRAVRGARRGHRRRRAPVRACPAGDGPVVDGDQPVAGGDAEEPSAHQPLPDRQHRAARQRTAVAHRAAQRDGRPGVGGPRDDAPRIPVGERSRAPRRDAQVLEPARRRAWHLPGSGRGPRPSSSGRSRTERSS